MNTIKEHFEAEAEEFDGIIIKLIPYYGQMLRALTDSIPFDTAATIRVLDLGCGTGTIAKKIIDKYPRSKIVCMDIASSMIAIAKHKLSAHAATEFITGDFAKIDFNGHFDVIVSSLALHHLETDNKKRAFYAKIFKALSSGGVFYNADVVLASADYNQKVNMDRWIEFMNKSVPMEEITDKWIPTHKEEDKPAKLIDQVKWLEDIGFKSIDVIWKYYNFCVYGGVKE